MKTEKQIADEVESWNWNLSIFEIYDEVRDNPDSLNERMLTYAYHFFNKDKMIAELASFLGVEIEKEATIVGGRVVKPLSPVWSE